MKIVVALVFVTLGLATASATRNDELLLFAAESKRGLTCLCCDVGNEPVVVPSACFDYGYFTALDGGCPPIQKCSEDQEDACFTRFVERCRDESKEGGPSCRSRYNDCVRSCGGV